MTVVILVVPAKLNKLNGVWLYIDTKIKQMHERVNHALEENNGANHLVEINIVVKREILGKS